MCPHLPPAGVYFASTGIGFDVCLTSFFRRTLAQARSLKYSVSDLTVAVCTMAPHLSLKEQETVFIAARKNLTTTDIFKIIERKRAKANVKMLDITKPSHDEDCSCWSRARDGV